jgi:hypothetical protein
LQRQFHHGSGRSLHESGLNPRRTVGEFVDHTFLEQVAQLMEGVVGLLEIVHKKNWTYLLRTIPCLPLVGTASP